MLWLIIGLIIGVGGWWLVSWTGRKKLGVKWYEWLLAALAVAFALLAIQNLTASIAELEPQAGGILLALFGVPALWWIRRGSALCLPVRWIRRGSALCLLVRWIRRGSALCMPVRRIRKGSALCLPVPRATTRDCPYRMSKGCIRNL
ncbi:MAG: hypothetical protein HY782_19360 [Chloroflexi bacterium]|nr:hypothetical protein [Chloroflexota bacterium]